MSVIRLRLMSSEASSTCPIFMPWTLPSCTSSPCRCLHSAPIVTSLPHSIVVCAESVERHQPICLHCVLLLVLLPCPFIALLSRHLFPIHISIHIYFSRPPVLIPMLFLFSFSSHPFTSPSLYLHLLSIPSVYPHRSRPLAHPFRLFYSVSTSLTFLATLSPPSLLLFFLPPVFILCPFSSSLYVIKTLFDRPPVSPSFRTIPLLSSHSPFHFSLSPSTTTGRTNSCHQLSPCLPPPLVSTYI